jgi:Outer membrane cytochrome MtrC/MtrF-like, domains II/IV
MKIGVLFPLVALVAGMLSGAGGRSFTRHDKAYYMQPDAVDFVRPGLLVKITGASIAADGTITANFTVTDPQGLPLDVQGVTTPGAVSTSFVAAYIPKGTGNWLAMTSSVQKSPITGNSANQPAADRGGTVAVNGNAYTYTFHTTAPAGFDTAQTVRIGMYASRNLSEFDLGTNYADSVYTFVPNGSPVTETHDVIATASCNRCHDPLSAHGGSRRLVPLCVMCHNPGGNGVDTVDPDTGNSIDFEVMIHKIHDGSSLPSVQAGTPYQIIGFNQSVNDFSTVVFPADIRNCEMCHEPGAYPRKGTAGTAFAGAGLPPNPLHVDSNGNLTGGSDNADTTATPVFPGTGDPTAGPGGATAIPVSAEADPGEASEPAPADANRWLTKPNSAACGSCHDDVNFTTGKNHAGGLPVTDSECSQCHIPQGDLPFDASILGGHTIPQWTPGVTPGVNFKLISASGTAGGSPTVTFSITDNSGNPIAPSSMGLLNLVMAGPTGDYSSVVSESATGATAAGSTGAYTYTFKATIPADATGTYTIGIEGYRNYTVLPGTVVSQTVRDVGYNQLLPFSVDGSPVAPHPVEAVEQDCNGCHYRISAHGGIRENVQYCLLCHNPNATDASMRPANQGVAQGIDFPVLIHRLHTGASASPGGQMTPFVVWGFGGSANDFSGLLYPSDLGDCSKCHVNSSDFPPVPDTRISVNNPRDYINPTPPTTAACTACHTLKDASAHAATMTSSSLGESCGVCHGAGAAFSVDQVHSRTL